MKIGIKKFDKDLIKHLFHKLGYTVNRYDGNKHDQIINLMPNKIIQD